MKTVLLLLSLLYTSSAYTTQRGPGTNLCEIDIQPGFFENKLVPGGTYIYDTTEFDTAEECMQSCCDQSLNSYSSQMICNMAYFYQEPDPYNPGELRNVCVWWNCRPGACQPRRDVDPHTTSRVGFILPQQQQEPAQDQVPYVGQYPDDKHSYQYQAGDPYGQPADSRYQSGNQNDPALSIPNNQLETSEAVPSNIHNQPVPSSRPILQNEGLPLSNDAPQESVNSLLTGNSDNGERNWVYDPSTGQYVQVYPPSAQAAAPLGPNSPIPYEPDNLTAAVEQQLNDTLRNDELNETEPDTATGEPYTTTVVYTSTQAQGWFWGKWWSNGDKDDDDHTDVDVDDDDEDEDFEDDDDLNGEEWLEEKNDTNSWYDDQYATEDAEWEKEEEEWEEEEEEEEEEWEKEMEEWEEEAAEEGTTKSGYYTTTLSAEELARLEEEELEEEKELEEWLDNYEGKEDSQKAEGEDDEQQQPVVQSEGDEFYKPETYAQSPQSNWSVNAPVIVIGACAGVVLIALVFILIGKKLTGKTDRAQYKPLRESFSGSSTYHEDI